MNCSTFDTRAVHVLLGQESDASASAWSAHRIACPKCAASAARIESLLRGLRTTDAPATSARFRARLQERVESIRAAELLREPEPGSAWRAWARRYRQPKNIVSLALAAAAILLIALFAPRFGGGFDDRASDRDVAIVAPPTNAADGSKSAPATTAGAREPAEDVAGDPSRARTAIPALTTDQLSEAERDRGLADPLAGVPTAPPDILQRARGTGDRGSGFATVRDLLRRRLPGEATTDAPTPIVATVTSHAARWLLDEQRPDGSFDPARAGGTVEARVGATALAVLALEGAPGISGGIVAQRIERGAAWLWTQQDANGTFGEVAASESITLFNHAAATLALARRYGARPEGERPHAQRLADAVLRLDDLDRQRGARAAVDGDVVAARFAALALEAAREARVPSVVDLERVVARVRAEHEGMVDPTYFRSGMFPPQDQVQAAVTAAAAMPWDPDATTARARALPVPTALEILDHPELREASLLYCTALVLRARGTSGWETYRQRLTHTLVKTHQQNGTFRSGYVFDVVGDAGGQIYETALGILTLRLP